MNICRRIDLVALTTVFIYFLSAGPVNASDKPGLSSGQTLYVPAYSHIYSGDREQPFLLTVTLAIRNTDPRHGLTVSSVEYYDSKGARLNSYAEKPLTLGPLESTRYVVPQTEKAGGSGASFIVKWRSDKPLNPPIIESIMIGTQSQQGISFTSRGQVLLPSGRHE